MNIKRLMVLLGFSQFIAMPVVGLPAPGDQHWDSQFGPVGTDERAYGLTVSGNKLYVGGFLYAAGNLRANLIAGYDGTNWFALNKGLSGDPSVACVYALANDEKYIYAAGSFTNADGTSATNVARWDGTNWSAMDVGLGPYVFSLKIVGTNLYAGGIFPNTNGVTFNCLARWTGSNWKMVPGDFAGFLPVVSAIESDGTNIYVGGQFDSVSGINSPNVASWNGNSWSAVGSGISGVVNTLLYHGNSLYAGGAFTNASATITNGAVWNGQSWSAWGNADRPLHCLTSDGANIYAGGEFTSVGGIAASGITKWDGANWSALGKGIQGFGAGSQRGVYKLGLDAQGNLYAAGNFNAVDGIGVSHVAGWDGNTWFSLGGQSSRGLTHFLGQVSAIFANNGTLYSGGLFTEAGEQVVNHLAAWDGGNWSSVGGGVSGTSTAGFAPLVRCFAVMGTNLYVGGSFATAGSVSANNLAWWDGSSWWPLGNGPDSTVRALATDGTFLYVGGIFTNVDSVASPGLAMWDGFVWSSLGTLSGGGRLVNAIVADGTDVYIAGNFTAIDGTSTLNVARWDGQQWNPLGSGLNATVSALAITNGTLYAGGSFTTAGGVAANHIAKWDGANWSSLDSGTPGTVSAVALRGSEVFVGGLFLNAGSVVSNGVAKWDGTAWSSLGSGLSTSPGVSGTPSAATLAFIGNDLFVGGNFSLAGDKPSLFIARWNDQLNFYPPPQPQLVNVTPQPSRQFQFRLVGTSGEQYVVQSSTDLKNWTPLVTNTAILYDFTDTNAADFPSQVYRAVIP